MKPAAPTHKPVDRAQARNCMARNLLATPGLGSLAVGRIRAGIGQLAVSLIGFVLFIIWFIKIISEYYGQIGGNVEAKPVGWIGITGGVLFAAAWFWSLATSVSVDREARENEIAATKQNLNPPKS